MKSVVIILSVLLLSCSTSKMQTTPVTTDSLTINAPLYITDSTGKLYAILDTNNILKVFDSSGTIRVLLNAVNKLDKCSLQTTPK